MTPFTFLLAALATWQAVEAFHHGTLFSTTRARLEVADGWLADLLLCPFCLSVWVGGAAALIALLPVPAPNGDPVRFAAGLAMATLKLWAYALAVSRVANLGNDVFHALTRTPGEHVSDEDDDKPAGLREL